MNSRTISWENQINSFFLEHSKTIGEKRKKILNISS
jgi:hypothetical protein